jgi:hypothetical protein
MERISAAQENALGIEVTTLPLLAARLVGGFRRSAAAEVIQVAIRAMLYRRVDPSNLNACAISGALSAALF